MDSQNPKQCKCPLRPYLGSWARDSASQSAADARWRAEHGAHPYANVRDELARALQAAEAQTSAEAVLDMVQDVFNLPRRNAIPVADVAENHPLL